LAAAAQRPQAGRRRRPEDLKFVQHPVEGGPASIRAAVGVFGGEQLQDVPDRDRADAAPFGRSDQRGPVTQLASGRARDAGLSLARLDPGETVRVAERGQRPDQQPTSCRSAADQPAQRRTHQVGADRDRQRLDERCFAPGTCAALLGEPTGRHLSPERAGGVGATGHPAFLPTGAGLRVQPTEQQSEAADAFGLPAGVGRCGERHTAQPGKYLLVPLAGRRPRAQRRARRIVAAERQRSRAGRRPDLVLGGDDAHALAVPKRTSSASGR